MAARLTLRYAPGMTDTMLPRIARIALVVAAIFALVMIGRAVLTAQVPATARPDIATVMTGLEAKTVATPNDPAAWRAFAAGLVELEQFETGANAYRRALALEPGNAVLWSSLGHTLTLQAQGLTPAARDAFARAIARDPRDFRARYFSAIGKEADGRAREAIDDWVGLLREAPPGAPWADEVRQTLTRVAAREKIDLSDRLPSPPTTTSLPGPAQIAAMVEALAIRLKTNPGDVEGWTMLARSRMVLGQPDAAREALRQARLANPGAAVQLDTAARALGL